MFPKTLHSLCCFLFHLIALNAAIAADSELLRYAPHWSSNPPVRTVEFNRGNGNDLVRAVEALRPGDRLRIAAGRYTIDRMWDITTSGTPTAPVRIEAAEAGKVIITRSNSEQNVVNIGQGRSVEFLCIQGIEFTGGSHGMRLGKCKNVWIDNCHIHHTTDVCLSANSADTSRLYLTRNDIHHGGGHGEGMYLGANQGEKVMSESVIALNHIHDCGGSQGDGIEVKQGSWGNLIAENHVHDTHYPCITVYGTDGKSVNTIERNLCYRSDDHVMQVQGEAVVRNNVLISSKGACFASTDHQGKTLNLQVIHNTLVNTAHAFSGSSWNGRSGMVLANNILYSRDENAINFPNGNQGVMIRGNVVFGAGNDHGSARGRGLNDFVSMSWDGNKHDATPSPDAPLNKADDQYRLEFDLNGKKRSDPIAGAISPR
ncbi:MAG: right-handed parallel beta-helix repeat-containing protein [Pirellulales bacterium]